MGRGGRARGGAAAGNVMWSSAYLICLVSSCIVKTILEVRKNQYKENLQPSRCSQCQPSLIISSPQFSKATLGAYANMQSMVRSQSGFFAQ